MGNFFTYCRQLLRNFESVFYNQNAYHSSSSSSLEGLSDDCLESSDDEEVKDSKMNGNYVLDAADFSVINTKRINFEELSIIERLTSFDEKISLIFLLYDEVDISLQTINLLKMGSYQDIVTEWAKTQLSNSHWNDKLLETLAIIQNYAILRKLGYDKHEIQLRFSPRLEGINLFVNKTKKILYLLCDNLNLEETERFIKHLEMKYSDEDIIFDNNHLEITFLSLAKAKIISFDTNLAPIIEVLKLLDVEKFHDALKKCCLNNTELHSNKKDNNVLIKTEQLRNVNRNSYCIDQNVVESLQMEYESIDSNESDKKTLNKRISNIEKCYNIDRQNPGVCLIINQENFYTEYDENLRKLIENEQKLEDRLGTEKDCKELEETFEAFGFNVIVEHNKTDSEILDTIKTVVNKITIESSLFVCILSHGREGHIYGVNSIPVNVKSIQNLMCTRNLKNMKDKPKILILQACQGNKCQEVFTLNDNYENDDQFAMDGSTEVIAFVDMLTFSATIPGFGAVRDKKNGTWFIQSLCQKLKNHYSDYHFQDICTLVKNEVTGKRWGPKVMVPEMKTTLSKFFYLPPYKKE